MKIVCVIEVDFIVVLLRMIYVVEELMFNLYLVVKLLLVEVMVVDGVEVVIIGDGVD